MVASEKYGSGSLERKYRFSAENGHLERIGRKREITSFFKQFFKVTMHVIVLTCTELQRKGWKVPCC